MSAGVPRSRILPKESESITCHTGARSVMLDIVTRRSSVATVELIMGADILSR